MSFESSGGLLPLLISLRELESKGIKLTHPSLVGINSVLNVLQDKEKRAGLYLERKHS